MNTYVNRFAFTMNNFKEEVAISFSQESPVFDEGGVISGVQLEPVSNLIMNDRMARDLAEKLLAMLDSDVPEPTEEDQ